MSNSDFHRAGSQSLEKPQALDTYLRNNGQAVNMPLAADPKLATSYSDLSKSSVDSNSKGFALGSVENPISLQTTASTIVAAPASAIKPEVVRVRYTSSGEGSQIQSSEGLQQSAPIMVSMSESTLSSSSLPSSTELSEEDKLAQVHDELLHQPPHLTHVPWPVEEKHLPTTVSIQHPIEEAKPSLTEKIQTKLGSMKDSITGTASSMKDTISEKASTLKDTIQSKMSKSEDSTPVVEEETIVTEVYNPADDVMPSFVYMAPPEPTTTEKISSKIKETTQPMKQAVSNAATSVSNAATSATTYTKETVLPQIGQAATSAATYTKETVVPQIGQAATSAATYTKETVLPQLGQAATYTKDTVFPKMVEAASSAATYTKDTIIPNVTSFTKESVIPRVEQAATYTKETIIPSIMEAAHNLKEKVQSVMHRRTESGRVVEEEETLTVDRLTVEHKEVLPAAVLEEIKEQPELHHVELEEKPLPTLYKPFGYIAWPKELLLALRKRVVLRHVETRVKTLIDLINEDSDLLGLSSQ